MPETLSTLLYQFFCSLFMGPPGTRTPPSPPDPSPRGSKGSPLPSRSHPQSANGGFLSAPQGMRSVWFACVESRNAAGGRGVPPRIPTHRTQHLGAIPPPAALPGPPGAVRGRVPHIAGAPTGPPMPWGLERHGGPPDASVDPSPSCPPPSLRMRSRVSGGGGCRGRRGGVRDLPPCRKGGLRPPTPLPSHRGRRKSCHQLLSRCSRD